MPKKTPLKPIPRFASEAEERDFWETHDSTEYLDWSKAERVRLPNPEVQHHVNLAQTADRVKPILNFIAALIVLTIAAGTAIGSAYAIDYLTELHAQGWSFGIADELWPG